MKIYLDTSFLVSLYSLDRNSLAAVRLIRASGNRRVMTNLGEFEAENALQLRVFHGEISLAQAQASWDDLTSDLRAGILQLIPLPPEAFTRGLQLSRQTTARMGTRSADILHIAAALELGCEALYSFDQRQRKLARAMHLKLN